MKQEDKQQDKATLKNTYNFYKYVIPSFIGFAIIVRVLNVEGIIAGNLLMFMNAANFLLLILTLISTYALANQLKKYSVDKTHPILWAIVMFIPIFNLIAMFIMYKKARRLIRHLGD
jgi:phosphate starvation-inducible membrane PsiE